jgi:hypothetical protein
MSCYIAGGRLPWKIRGRNYLLYVLISLALVATVILAALYEGRKHDNPSETGSPQWSAKMALVL